MKILGIKVGIHWSMWALLALVVLSRVMAGGSVEAALMVAGFASAVFFCVLLHEFGHALAARRFGIGTKDIVLYPMGGIARFDRIPRDPMQEFWVAIAGPAVNAVLAGGLYLASKFVAPEIMLWLVQANIVLACFNLLPAFPMDGGRMFRALMALWVDYVKATYVAAKVATVMAVLFGLWGIVTNNFMLAIIGVFVYMSAEGEYQQVLRDEARGNYEI